MKKMRLMCRMMLALLIGMASVTVSYSQTTRNQTHLPAQSKTLLVIGSSMASGWVTSYETKYDMQNGYLARLARELESSGWKVINKSVPGFTTSMAYELLVEELSTMIPDYVYIGLSMSNEGLETHDPDSVYASYRNGMQKIIKQILDHGAKPVIGLCYPNDNYTPKHYAYIKKMNLDIAGWGYPCINLLGALDDGNGHFPTGYTFDPNHPNNHGHEEFFLAFPYGFFEALDQNGANAIKWPETQGLKLGTRAKNHRISYMAPALVHSFTLAFECQFNKPGQIADILSIDGSHTINLSPEGTIEYQSPGGRIESISKPDLHKWHQVVICHSYLNQSTSLYLDGQYQSGTSEQIEMTDFSLGLNAKKMAFRNLLFYKACLTPEEVELISQGVLYQPSLELASTLADLSDSHNPAPANLARSKASLLLDSDDLVDRRAKTADLIRQAEKLRALELIIPPKKPIELDPSTYQQFAGKYEIAPGDYFEVLVRDHKLFFADRGNEAELLPESPLRFFIQYPVDLTVTFVLENKVVSGLIFWMNGQEIKGKRVK